MAAPPSLLGSLQLTTAAPESPAAVTAVGALGATAPLGVTAAEAADCAPSPVGLDAVTRNVYAVPGVRPLIVVLVAGGVPLIVFGVCAVDPMYGVTVYEVTGPPDAGAVQLTVADALPAVAVTPVAAPGAPAGA